MVGHIFSLVTLVLIYKHVQSEDEVFSDRNKFKRIGLMVLSFGFSILYFICGSLSISKGISVISLFKMEYGLCFVYSTYRLYVLNKDIACQMKYSTSEHRINSYNIGSDANNIDQLIKDTMICLEDEDFEKASELIDKVDTLCAVDQNIELLKTIVNQSKSNKDPDYAHSFCY